MEYIKAAIIILGLFHVVRLYFVGRKARLKTPPANYFKDSQANSAPWRWRIPHNNLALEIADTKNQSSINFLPNFKVSDHLITACGFFAYAGTIVFAIFGLYLMFFGDTIDSWRVTGSFLLAIMLCFLGMSFISTGQRILSLIRKPTGLKLQYSYGTWLTHSLFIGKQEKVLIEVKSQSVIDYDVFQNEPFYIITIKRESWFSFSPSKFYITVNPKQIGWIQEGLSDFFIASNTLNI